MGETTLAQWLYETEASEEIVETYSIFKDFDHIGAVLYTTYNLHDGSKITLGDNGYMGGEW